MHVQATTAASKLSMDPYYARVADNDNEKIELVRAYAHTHTHTHTHIHTHSAYDRAVIFFLTGLLEECRKLPGEAHLSSRI
jgi:hypothetical protein